MVLVAALPGHNADDSAQGAAVLGRVAAGLDLDFVHEFKGRRLLAHTSLGSGDVRAVDVEHVLGTGSAVNRKAAQPGLSVDARNGRGQGVEVSSAGKDLEHLFGQSHALHRALDIDQGRLSDDRHFLFQGAHLQNDIQLDCHFQLNDDPFSG